MNSTKILYVTGYRAYELGIFKGNDPKIGIIKKALKMAIISYLEEGLEWIVGSGQQGVEMWCGEIVADLKEEYQELHYSILFPYANFGKNWKEDNQLALEKIRQEADYVNEVSKQEYQNPQQLKNHTRFLLEHTSGCLAVYDVEYPGKSQFFVKEAKKYQEKNEYGLDFITLEDLQNQIVEE